MVIHVIQGWYCYPQPYRKHRNVHLENTNTCSDTVHFPCFESRKPNDPSFPPSQYAFPSITAKALYGQHNDSHISFFSFVVVKVLPARLTSAHQHKLSSASPWKNEFCNSAFWGGIEAHCTLSCTTEWATIKSEYILEPWVNHILQNPLLTSDKCLEMWAVIL